jgi:hypothetical protein
MQTVNVLVSPLRLLHDWFFEPVDGRTYAAVRVATGVAGLAIWLELWPLRYSLFSDVGLFGSSPVSGNATLNLFGPNNSVAVVDSVFLCALLSLLCLLLGVFTRVAAVAVYLWAASYSSQTPIALAGYDTVFRATIFALVLSPASAFSSVRPWWFAGSRKPLPRYGVRLMQWQLLLIYWCTVWLKAPDQYWRRGEIVSHMLMSNFGRFPSPKAADLGVLDPLLTWGTLLIEVLVPVLLWKQSTRLFGAFLGLMLHAGIAIATNLSLFSLAMFPLYLAFFETRDWNRLGEWVRRGTPANRIRAAARS